MTNKVNKKSVDMQPMNVMGQQPMGASQPAQQQVDPAVQEITTFFTSAIEEGRKPEEVVMGLMTQEVDQNVIVQALMGAGYQEEDITLLFESVALLAQAKPANANQVNKNPQELARNQELAERDPGGQPVEVERIDPVEMMDEAKSGIEIKEKNKGKFTKWAKARGMAVQEAARKVLANKDRYPASVVKMANFARNAAKWKKEEGGENYLPMAEDAGETNLSTLDFINNQKGSDIYSNMQNFMNAANTSIVGSDGSTLLNTGPGNTTYDEANPNIKKNDFSSTIQPGPLYLNPVGFGNTGNNFSLAKGANTLLEGYNTMFSGKDLDGDGLKDGSWRDWSNKSKVNKFNKYLNADYEWKVDDSDENKEAAMNWYNQFLIENPTLDDQYDAVGNLISTGVEGVTVNKPVLTNIKEKSTNWINQNTEGLSETAKKTYEALLKKIKTKSGREMEQGGVVPEGWSVPEFISAIDMRTGGGLPRAQYSVPDQGPPFAQNDDANNPGGPLSFQDWVLQDAVTRSGPNAKAEYDQYVLNTQNTSPVDNAVDNITDNEFDAVTTQEEVAATPTADELFQKINMPELDVSFGGLQGFVDRTMNSNVVRAWDDASNFLVKGADFVNDWFEDKKIDDAKIDNRNRVVADEIYATEVDPFNSRGMWDINTGRAGSEGDRTTGLYMTKKGGEKKTKNVVNVDAAMLAKLLAAGADIEML